MNPTKMMNFHKKWIPLLLLCNIMVLTVMMPLIAYAQESDQKNVRVGWYESPFNYTDQNGRRSGYAYEYQKKVAAYTSWNTNMWKAAGPSFCRCSLTVK